MFGSSSSAKDTFNVTHFKPASQVLFTDHLQVQIIIWIRFVADDFSIAALYLKPFKS